MRQIVITESSEQVKEGRLISVDQSEQLSSTQAWNLSFKLN